MKIEYETAWRVYWIEVLRQWVVAPPDGYYNNDKQWVYLTNVHNTYWPNRKVAWERAKTNAKKMRSVVISYYKYKEGIMDRCDYRPRGVPGEKVQAT